jgi:hypothetical protein
MRPFPESDAPMFPFFPGDIVRYFAAICIFGLVVMPPGFVLGWSANLLGFRTKVPLFRLYTATALGISVPPILMYLCWSLGSLSAVWVLYGFFWTAFIVLLALRKLHLTDLFPPRTELFLATGWVVLVALIVLDLRIGAGVYINWASIDHSFRVSLIQAIRDTIVLPTSNPFFFPGHPVPFRYHYFWFMLAAFVQAIGGGFIGARDALFASIAWSGLAIVAVAALFLPGHEDTNIASWRRRTWLTAALMSITGLDLIPDGLISLFVSLSQHRLFIPFGDFEFWNGDGQVTSWLGSSIWVPNHVGGLVCGCTGVLLLLWAYRSPDRSSRISASLLAGCAFASAAGCSIYVVFVFLVALGALFVAGVLLRNKQLTIVLALSGVTAFIAALPYLHELRVAQGGTPFAVLRPRTFGPVFWFMHGTPSTLDAKGVLAMLLCLPLNYALELGFFAAIGRYKLRKMHLRKTQTASPDPRDRVLLFLLIAGMVIGSFLASVALPHNDLGWRAMLVPQFVLLLWAVEWSEDVALPAFSSRTLFKGVTGAVVALALIGLAGTVCDAAMLRFYAVAIDNNHGTSPNRDLSPGLGERTAELRTIYTEALKSLPASTLVQQQPAVLDAVQQGIYSSWASAERGREYGPSYGGDRSVYDQTEALLRPVFEQPVDSAYVSRVCAETHIGAIVVQDLDPAWHEPGSWIWSVPPVYFGKHARAFSCADILRSASTAAR